MPKIKSILLIFLILILILPSFTKQGTIVNKIRKTFQVNSTPKRIELVNKKMNTNIKTRYSNFPAWIGFPFYQNKNKHLQLNFKKQPVEIREPVVFSLLKLVSRPIFTIFEIYIRKKVDATPYKNKRCYTAVRHQLQKCESNSRTVLYNCSKQLQLKAFATLGYNKIILN